jgi:conjugative transfer signal peptidase TraF
MTLDTRRILFTLLLLAGPAGLWLGHLEMRSLGLGFNMTGSGPKGLWWRTPLGAAALHRGELVIVCPPVTTVVQDMRRRGYLEDGDCATHTTPILKPVVAVAGDIVILAPTALMTINGRPVPASAPKANMPAWPAGEYHVPAGEVWTVSSYSPESFDSRYFGPVSIDNVRGRARPIWIFGDVGAMTSGGGAHP